MAWHAKVETNPEIYDVVIVIWSDSDETEKLRVPISDEAAQHLYAALANHYKSPRPTGDMRILRELLDQERQRCDRLIEHLAAATRAAE